MCVYFLPVTEAVLVGVRHLGIRVMGIEFSCVTQSVGVGVLFSIHDSIPVGVFDQWIRIENSHFNSITESVPVCIRLQRIGFVEVYFLPVTQAVPVGVHHLGIG